MIENPVQRRMNFIAKFNVIKKEFFQMTEQAFSTLDSAYLNLLNQKTIGDELHCDFDNSKYLISVRLDLMSVNIYVWIYDQQSGRNRMFGFDDQSEKFKMIEAKRSKRATENFQSQLLLQIQNAMSNDEVMNAEPAFDYYLKEGREENMHIICEYALKINERLKSNQPLI